MRWCSPLTWHTKYLLIKDCLVLSAGITWTGSFLAAQLLISFIHFVKEGQYIIIGNSLIRGGVVVEVSGSSELRVDLLELLLDGFEQVREPVVFLEGLVSTSQFPPICFFLDPRKVNLIEIKCGSFGTRVAGASRIGRRPIVNVLICVVYVLVGDLAGHLLGKVPQLLGIHVNHGVEISGFLLL